jgi:hypothetical protein
MNLLTIMKRLINTYRTLSIAYSHVPQTGKSNKFPGYLLWYAMFHPIVLSQLPTQIYRPPRNHATYSMLMKGIDFIRAGAVSYKQR